MRVVMGLAAGAVFFGAMAYFSLAETQARCEVCVDFRGKRECRAGSGADARSAQMIAISVACAALAGTRTENIRCQATRPSTLSCE